MLAAGVPMVADLPTLSGLPNSTWDIVRLERNSQGEWVLVTLKNHLTSKNYTTFDRLINVREKGN